MWMFSLAAIAFIAYVNSQNIQSPSPRSGDELVSTVLDNCVDMTCVKENVLGYLDNLLHIKGGRNVKVTMKVICFWIYFREFICYRTLMLLSIRESPEF